MRNRDQQLFSFTTTTVTTRSIHQALCVVHSLSHVWLFATQWTAARQASPFFTMPRSLLKLMSIESMIPSNHLILCRPLFLLPIEYLLCVRYWSNCYSVNQYNYLRRHYYFSILLMRNWGRQGVRIIHKARSGRRTLGLGDNMHISEAVSWLLILEAEGNTEQTLKKGAPRGSASRRVDQRRQDQWSSSFFHTGKHCLWVFLNNTIIEKYQTEGKQQ